MSSIAYGDSDLGNQAKPSAFYIEDAPGTDDATATEAHKYLLDVGDVVTEEEEKRVLRKIDWKLVPIMVLLNAVQLVDKNVRITDPSHYNLADVDLLDTLRCCDLRSH